MATNQKPPFLTTALSLTQTLTSFLTVFLHNTLYHRSLYPPTTFLRTRAYNYPVHQSRHPAVCGWINSTITHLHPLLLKGAVRRVALVIYNADAEVMERFMVDVERFPVCNEKEAYVEFAAREGQEGRDGGKLMKGIPRVDIEEQLRAAIRRLEYSCEKLSPLPENCTYTVAVELRDEAEVPIGNPQPWIPSEPSLQTGEKGDSQTIGRDLGGVRSMPVRLVEAGEFIMEMWIEEGRAKVSDGG